MLPMVAVVAEFDPEIAANKPQAPNVAIIIRHGSSPNTYRQNRQRCNTRTVDQSPVRMNSGIANRANPLVNESLTPPQYCSRESRRRTNNQSKGNHQKYWTPKANRPTHPNEISVTNVPVSIAMPQINLLNRCQWRRGSPNYRHGDTLDIVQPDADRARCQTKADGDGG